MTIIAAIGLIMNTSIAVVAASRLIFAVARDGVLPFSGFIGRVTSDGQPRNAVTIMFAFGAALLCTILPSQVAFTSLISAGGVPTIAAYGLIAALRLTMTPDHFKASYYYLGRYRKLCYLAAALFNALIFSVMISPFYFPVSSQTFNFVSPIQVSLATQSHKMSHRTGVCDLWSGYNFRGLELCAHTRGEVAPSREDHPSSPDC